MSDNNNHSKCPVMHGANTNQQATEFNWWPKTLNLDILHQHDHKTDPMGADFNYADAFNSLDLEGVKKDLKDLMTDSQDW